MISRIFRFLGRTGAVEWMLLAIALLTAIIAHCFDWIPGVR